MPNKKINALDVRVAVATDLMLVGDPATGTAYKSTLATLPLVPYTGATGAVNLGAYDLTVNELTIGKGLAALSNNTAIGKRSLFHTTTGNYNTAVGHEAGHNLTTGQYNTAIGQSSMFTATSAAQNTAIGVNALLLTTSGGSNVVVGLDGMQHNTTGSSNTAIGYNAGSHITGGSTPNTTASNSIYIGRDSKPLADGQSNQIVIGYNAVGNGSNTATIGNSSITANYFTGSINGGSFVKSGGTSDQFLKADGSVDSSAYVTSNIYTANGTLSGNRVLTTGGNTLALRTGGVDEFTFTPNNGTIEPQLKIYNVTYGGTLDLGYGYIKTSGGNLSIGTTNFGDINIFTNNAKRGTIFNTTGNWLIQTGGTYLDAGFKLDVQGTANISSSITAASLIKSGGTSAQILAADGSVITAGTNITISGGTISSSGGGGGSMAIGGAITSATAGSVLFAGTSGVLQQDNANLFWDDANNRLGIGTATPTKALDVASDILVNGNTIGKGNNSILENTAFGVDALKTITSGLRNTGIGYFALKLATSGSYNLGIGAYALNNLTTGSNNFALGATALWQITTANNNIAIGTDSSYSMTTGSGNTSIGTEALKGTTSGQENLAIGYRALSLNGTGSFNIGIGAYALSPTTTSNNTGIGYGVLFGNTSGGNNTAIGFSAGRYISGGGTANTITNNSIFIGYETKALASNQTNQIVIGYQETGLGSNTTIIGNSSTITTALRGRLLLGTTTDSGLYQLDVNGTARVSGKLSITAGTTAASQINLASSTAPTSPNNGDIWFDGTNLLMRIGGVTKTFTLV